MLKPRMVLSGALLTATLAACLPGSSPGQSSDSSREPRPEHALRLTFEYREGELSLLDVQELQMVVPMAERERVLELGELPSGYALELQGTQETTLLVREFDDPLTLVSETPDPEDPARIRREVTEIAATTFSVLVPATPGARLVLVTRPSPGQEGVAPARQRRETLGAFELDSYDEYEPPREEG
ncbi:MAG TPA: hypothetical protein VLF66_09610 [Thermoanaerobaculia bacterium]|nr:hypothetical protein [Thermoanaerobaculia bacterium]